MTLKNGATGTTVKLTWHVAGMPEQVTPQATSHFVGLIRNASVRQVSLTGPLSHHFMQKLSAADVDVAVGSLEVRSFTPEDANLAVGRGSLMSFHRLEKLAIYDTPLELLSDDLLLAATQKRVMSLTLKSHRFQVGDGRAWGGGGWNTNGPARWHVQAAATAEVDCPELCDSVLAFLFRDDLDENAKVELRFPGARVPQDFCQSIMDRAISAGTRYSIDASFVAVSKVDEDLVGFQEYRRLDNHDPNYVVYNVPDPNVADAVVELKIIAVENDDWNANAPPLAWKLIEFRRCRKTGTSRFV
ncbi:hypothetical protein AAVH_35473 [Aphelenchoides avenae]|nr:hypothetical protein AAVH_35473 [Aphelenchus avenae]